MEQPTAIMVEAKVTRADGTVEDLGLIAAAHKDPDKDAELQAKVRGGPGVGEVRLGGDRFGA